MAIDQFTRSLPMMLYRALDTVMPSFRKIFNDFGLTEQRDARHILIEVGENASQDDVAAAQAALAAARKRIEGYFPGRDVHVIEMLASWYDGGGVHCHSNDQPAQ